MPKLPPVKARLALYSESAPRDAVNSLSNCTQNHSAWPKPKYVPPIVSRYRPDGSARDGWINSSRSETQGLHFDSDVDLYWKHALGKPEYRGKSKGALCSASDRFILYPHLKRVYNHPLVPTAARAAELANAMPPVKRTVFSGQWRVVEERNNAMLCDDLLARLQAERKA